MKKIECSRQFINLQTGGQTDCLSLSSFWSQIITYLDAAVSLLGPDAVLVVHPLDLGEAGVVVALQGPGKAGEVLEAAHLGSHVLVITTELRHLASKMSKLHFPLSLSP